MGFIYISNQPCWVTYVYKSLKYLVHEHGWKDEFGRISFRHTIKGKSERGFYIVNEPDRVVIRYSCTILVT